MSLFDPQLRTPLLLGLSLVILAAAYFILRFRLSRTGLGRHHLPTPAANRHNAAALHALTLAQPKSKPDPAPSDLIKAVEESQPKPPSNSTNSGSA